MQPAECDRMLEQLPLYLNNPDQYRAELEAAVRHIQTCAACARRVEHLTQALATDEEDALTCQECQDNLPEYLQDISDGQTDAVRWHSLAFHLATCPSCSDVYADLTDVVALAEGTRGVEPPRYPEPRFPFPTATAQPGPPSWHLDDLRRLVIAFSSEIVRTLRMPSQQPLPTRSGARSEATTPGVYRYALIDAVEDLDVTITAEQLRTDPMRCTVTIEADIPSRGGWPHLAGTEITLKRSTGELETRWTNAFGMVIFEQLPLDDLSLLSFTIEPMANS